MNVNEDFREDNDMFADEDAVTGPPPADELDELLRAWHDRNAAHAAAGRDRLLRALAEQPSSTVTTPADVTNRRQTPHSIYRASGQSAHRHPPVAGRSFFRRVFANRYSPAAAAAILLAALAGLLAPNPFGPTRDKTFAGTVMVPNGGRLDARDAAGRLIGPCPLQHTDVDASVLGRFARVTVRQTYQNPYDEKIEAVYTFPLSHRAAVDRMTMTIGDRVVIGEVHERNQARAIYQAARRQGRVASLLEQERPNIFTQSVANIEPGFEVVIEISYVEMLKETDGLFSFEFPMVVAPRYVPGSPEPVDIVGPLQFQPRHGVIELGPAALSIYDANDTDPDAPELDPARLRALMNTAKPIEWPDDPNEDPSHAPTLFYRLEAKYADGSIDYGTLYSDGTGELDGRWFYANLAATPSGGTGFAQDTDQVPDAARITPAPVPPETRAGHDISINVDIDTAGPGIYDVTSYLHDVQSYEEQVRTDGLAGKMALSLTDANEIPNRDFVLTWRQTADTITEQLFTYTGEQGGFFTLVLNPPERVVDDQIVPRELIFVLDTSGSMSGFPIEKAKDTMALAIDALRPEDTFNLITFAGDTHILWDRPRPTEAQSLAEAQAFLESREGGGGTEMMTAINAALERPADEYVLLTPHELADLPADGREVEVQVPARDTDVILQDGVAPGVIDIRLPDGDTIRATISYWSLDADYFNRPAEETIYRFTGRWNTVDGERLFEVDSATTTDKLEARPVRIVCFMTDGQVGNDQAIIDAVQRNAQTTRVFSFGIGNSPNRYLLDNMARAGRGAADYVLLEDEAAAKVQHFVERIQSPVLTDIRLEFSDGLDVTDRVPAEIPDLHDRSPIVIHGRFKNPGAGTLTITGMTGVGPYERVVNLDLTAENEQRDALPVLWARAKVEDLMNRDLAAAQSGNFPADLRQQIVDLGETFSIMTQFTSFVAVDHLSVTVEGEPRLIPVPVELPEGQDYESTFGKDVLDWSDQLLIEIQPAERQLQLVDQYGPADARTLLQLVDQIPTLVEEQHYVEALLAVDRVATIDGDQAWAEAMRAGIEEKRTAQAAAVIGSREDAENMIYGKIRERVEATVARRAELLDSGVALDDEQVTELERQIRKGRQLLLEHGETVDEVDPPLAVSQEPQRTLPPWMNGALKDTEVRARDRSAGSEQPDQLQDLVVESEEAVIPWKKDLWNRTNMPEISAAEVSDGPAPKPDEYKIGDRFHLAPQSGAMPYFDYEHDGAPDLDDDRLAGVSRSNALGYAGDDLAFGTPYVSGARERAADNSQVNGALAGVQFLGSNTIDPLVAQGTVDADGASNTAAENLAGYYDFSNSSNLSFVYQTERAADGRLNINSADRSTLAAVFSGSNPHLKPGVAPHESAVSSAGYAGGITLGRQLRPTSPPMTERAQEALRRRLSGAPAGIAEAGADSIIVEGAEEDLSTLQSVIDLLDKTSPGKNIEYVPLKNASAKRLAADLKTVFARSEQLGSSADPANRQIKIVPDPDTNGLYIAGDDQRIAKAQKLIEQIERMDLNKRRQLPASAPSQSGRGHGGPAPGMKASTAGDDSARNAARPGPSEEVLVESEEAVIPWDKNALFPKNWPEIAAKRTGAADVTETESTRQVRQKLKETVAEINFDGIPFETAIDYLRDVTGLNIVVNWTAMEFDGIERDAEVNLRLQNVPIEKSLDLLLNSTGGGETELAWTVRDGVILISTNEHVDRMRPAPRAAAAAERPARPESARSISPDQLALHIAALTAAGKFDEAVRFAQWLTGSAPKYEIGVQMLEVLTEDGLGDDDRAAQVALLGRRAAERIKTIALNGRTIVRKLDPRLLPFAFGQTPAADAGGDVTLHDGRILVTVLIADKNPATLDALKDAGLKTDDVTESADVAVGSIAPENLRALALLECVRRVTPL